MTYSNSKQSIKDADIELGKEYYVGVKDFINPEGIYVENGVFVLYNEVEIFFIPKRMNTVYCLDEITNVYKKCRIKEDRPLFDKKKVQIYERYKRHSFR